MTLADARADAWVDAHVPSLAGRRYLVTGANSGLGLWTSAYLAGAGATVCMACRNADKGRAAMDEIRQRTPEAELELVSLDLSSLDSVKSLADAWDPSLKLDGLINNAGIMAVPLARTDRGFESQIGICHLGHFALTLRMLSHLGPSARVVTVSSIMHRRGKIVPDDLNFEHRRYDDWGAYGQAKLANLMFALELNRRLRAAKRDCISVAAHPGYAATNLQQVGPELSGSRVRAAFMALGNRTVAQSAAMGSLPTIFAATHGELHGGEYIGPRGFMQMAGAPTLVGCSRAARDEAMARKLWEVSERLTETSGP